MPKRDVVWPHQSTSNPRVKSPWPERTSICRLCHQQVPMPSDTHHEAPDVKTRHHPADAHLPGVCLLGYDSFPKSRQSPCCWCHRILLLSNGAKTLLSSLFNRSLFFRKAARSLPLSFSSSTRRHVAGVNHLRRCISAWWRACVCAAIDSAKPLSFRFYDRLFTFHSVRNLPLPLACSAGVQRSRGALDRTTAAASTAAGEVVKPCRLLVCAHRSCIDSIAFDFHVGHHARRTRRFQPCGVGGASSALGGNISSMVARRGVHTTDVHR